MQVPLLLKNHDHVRVRLLTVKPLVYSLSYDWLFHLLSVGEPIMSRDSQILVAAGQHLTDTFSYPYPPIAHHGKK